MTEEMAVESLAKYRWDLVGYLVKTRIPYKGKKGGNRDIDVLAFHPKTKDCVIAGCKAWGSPEDYPTWPDTDSIRKRIAKLTSELTDDLAMEKAEEVMGRKPNKAVLYLPADIPQSLIEFAKQQCKIPIDIVPIHSLLIDLFSQVALDMRRRRTRYPDTALELIRWFNRSFVHSKLKFSDLERAIKEGWTADESRTDD